MQRLRRRCRALRAVCRRGLGGQTWHAGRAGVGGWTQLSPKAANAALQRLRRRCRALRAVCRRGVGGQRRHAGRAGVGGWKRSYPRGRQTRRCKGYGGDAARCGQYAGGGLAASVGTAGQPVLADGNEVIPGNGGDALRFARIIPRPFRAIAHNGVRISPRLAAVIPYFPAAFNRPCCNPNFA